MGLSLGGRADKRLPKQQAARCGGEGRPLKMEHIVRAPRPDRSEDPGCLTRPVARVSTPAPADHGRLPSPPRPAPRAAALAGTGTNRGHSNPSATGRPACNSSATAATRWTGLELSYSATASRGSVRAQPKFPALTDPTSAQKTARPYMRRTRSQKAARDRVRRCLVRSGSRGHSIGRTRTRPAERSRYGRGATAHDRL